MSCYEQMMDKLYMAVVSERIPCSYHTNKMPSSLLFKQDVFGTHMLIINQCGLQLQHWQLGCAKTATKDKSLFRASRSTSVNFCIYCHKFTSFSIVRQLKITKSQCIHLYGFMCQAAKNSITDIKV